MSAIAVSAIAAGCKQRAKQAISVQKQMINSTGVVLNESDMCLNYTIQLMTVCEEVFGVKLRTEG